MGFSIVYLTYSHSTEVGDLKSHFQAPDRIIFQQCKRHRCMLQPPLPAEGGGEGSLVFGPHAARDTIDKYE
jgi:hypothetical protein